MCGVLRLRSRCRRQHDAIRRAFAMFATTKRFSAATELINNCAEPKPLSKILGRLLVALPDKVRARENHTPHEK